MPNALKVNAEIKRDIVEPKLERMASTVFVQAAALFTLNQTFKKSWGMAKISLHALSILKKHMTEFLEINLGRFCRGMALMVSCYAPSSHSKADRRFVFG